MEIKLNKDSVVDSRTGEISAPSEFMENLQVLEAAVARTEDEVNALKGQLRHARDRYAELVARLRESVRDGRVLPLFEGLDPADETPDEDEVDDEA
ncbi:MAG TPA: hypothetical protein VGH59_01495 [Casimicrobiaceae bacterium]